MPTENARQKYTAMTSFTEVVTNTTLASLAAGGAVVGPTVQENDDDAAGQRNTLRNFEVTIGTTAARTDNDPIHLIIIPEGQSSVYGEIEANDDALANSYIATYDNGKEVTWTLDADTVSRVLTAAGVRIPMGNYKVGILNGMAVALGASGNSIYASGSYTVASVTE